ncbi:hypothetical protein C482_15261 [Natrialba chahannaoensis JCM 10990]|uniref:Uncharacterized protein n=1 Tax=Natrialba chahannaoensis JCM 10990 TaxID=1227492 RepID=M0ADB1_9EURY|nr:hypothetical protein [Natrialba chahannaoensis]ELY96745.1 hypothetical protein C482_15261 [Natrialba chahannaoensis JCM 10990]
MVQDLTAQELHSLDPDVLLEEALHDDRVLRLVNDAVHIKRQHISAWLGVDADEDVATLDPKAPIADIVEALAYEGFTPNWFLAYHYAGEEVNLVRFHYDPDLYPEQPFRQLHVRIFANGTLEAHEEASALMHKGPHIREESFDRDVGTEAVATILEDAGIDVDPIAS